MSTVMGSRRTGIVVVAMAAFSAACAVWIGLDVGGDHTSLIVDDAGTALAAILATACCVGAARRDHGRHRRFWCLLGGVCVCCGG